MCLSSFIGLLRGGNFSFLTLTARSLISPGRSPMGFFTRLLVWLHLVMILIPLAFVDRCRRLWSIYSFTALLPIVFFLGFSLSRLFPPLWFPPWFVGFSADELLVVPRVFVYILGVCKFFIWHARNDFRFRNVRPGAASVIENVKTCVCFHLPLHFKRFVFQEASLLPSSVGWSWCCGFCFW